MLSDKDDMVQKGLGWLLRESAKADAKLTMPLLMEIKAAAPRLVLRTACETLRPRERQRVLKIPWSGARRKQASGANSRGRGRPRP